MPLEIEAKIKVESHDAVRRRLAELGAERVHVVTETNQIFDTAERRLFGSGCGLRVRTCRGEGQVPAATLTFKGPPTKGPLKSREERETQVSQPQETAAILQALGFAPVLTFEKHREEWRLDDTKVELDELPRLGFYVEIEGPDEAAVSSARARLGLADSPLVPGTYIALLIEHARCNGLPADHITLG